MKSIIHFYQLKLAEPSLRPKRPVQKQENLRLKILWWERLTLWAKKQFRLAEKPFRDVWSWWNPVKIYVFQLAFNVVNASFIKC